MSTTGFDYSNLSGRAQGPFLRVASRLSRGVREVQAQVGPYAAQWQAHNHVAVAADGPLWVTLGDSMAQGIGASAYDRGWAGQLAGLVDPAYRHVNLSFTGARTDDLLERQVPAMAALGPADLVTVVIGSNDLFSPRHRGHLVERLTRLVPLLPSGTVISTLPQPLTAARAANVVLEAADHLVLADFRDPRMADWSGRLAADRFHPNDRGYAGMAAFMAEAVARR